MIARNAWFNLGKLGATADRFRRNFYGEMADSLNAGERSDRLVVRWALDRVPGPRTPPDVHETVAVPREYDALRASDPSAALSPTRDRVAEPRWRTPSRAATSSSAFDRAARDLRAGAGGDRVTRVRAVELRLVGLPLVRPFRTSFGTSTEKVCILARVETDDAEGWGECVADIEPDFSAEFNEGAWLVMRDFLVPALVRAGDVERRRARTGLRVRAGQPDGQGHDRRRLPRRRAARARRESLAAYLGAASSTGSRAASRSASRRPRTSCSTRSRDTSARAIAGSS